MQVRGLFSAQRNPVYTWVACIVVLTCVVSGFFLLTRAGEESPPEEVQLFGDSRYPVLLAGDAITRWEDILSVGFFAPLFSPERPVVNPATPTLERRRTLRFEVPGEYYLNINEGHFLKVLILDPREPISQGVVHIFDFLVANLLVSNGEQPLWDTLGPERYTQKWFRSKEPGWLLCGPTDWIFRALVFERFRLPNRMVTLPGAYRVNGKIVTGIHNAPEIYLPDIGKFVMFDVNNAFLVRWRNAIELAALIHDTAGEPAHLTRDHWRRLSMDVYQDWPRALRAKYVDVLRGDGKSIPFSRGLLSDRTVDHYWPDLLNVLYGGVAYQGHHTYGTGFLTPTFHFGSLHGDRGLESVAMKLLRDLGMGVGRYHLRQLSQMLEEGFQPEIAAAAWRGRVPKSVIQATERLIQNQPASMSEGSAAI